MPMENPKLERSNAKDSKNEVVSENFLPTMKDLEEPKKFSQICAVLMVKNEEKTVLTTLKSIKGQVDDLFVLDTGSTDQTKHLIQMYCLEHKMPLHMITQEFPFPFDFRKARNHLLDYVDEWLLKERRDRDWLILLDANDELRMTNNQRKRLIKFHGPQIGFYTLLEWKKDDEVVVQPVIRVIRANKKWRYGATPVHEALVNPRYDTRLTDEKNKDIVNFNKIVIYQDRRDEDAKSLQRFKNDKASLVQELLKIETSNDNYSRCLFYLGQTCMGLAKIAQDEKTKKAELKEAYDYYEKRTKIPVFREEIYHSFYNMGQIGFLELGMEWNDVYKHFIDAYQCSPRVEPLLFISGYYFTLFQKTKSASAIYLSESFAELAVKMPFPNEDKLFVDKLKYTYYRYRVLVDINYCIYAETANPENLQKAISMMKIAMENHKVKKDEEFLQELSKLQNKNSKN